MIGAIFGTIHSVKGGVALILANGVGYEMHVSDQYVGNPVVSALLDINPWWIHEVAPQDAPHELYGFRTREERDLFRRLLEVQGVGPKVAQRIVGTGFDFNGLGWTEKLKSIRGVGPKLAQRISEAFQ